MNAIAANPGLAQLLPRRLDYALESASAFFAMGGHGFWVWMAWGMALAAVIFENIFQSVRRKAALDAIRRIERAEKQSEQVSDEE